MFVVIIDSAGGNETYGGVALSGKYFFVLNDDGRTSFEHQGPVGSLTLSFFPLLSPAT